MIYPWQQKLWQKLISYQQYGHAYLFHGAQGLGKSELIREFAYRLLCHNPGNVACSVCKSCKLLQANTHPDIFYLKPLEEGKEIGIDEVRKLILFLSKTANFAGYKVVIAEQIELLNRNSANALLKSLEEPAGKSILLLTTNQISSLLPTITSRCLKVACDYPSSAEINSYINEKHPDLTAEQIKDLIFLAEGSPLLISNLLENNILEQRAIFSNGLKQLFKAQINVLELGTTLQKIELLTIVNWAYDLVVRIFRYKVSQDEQGLGLADTAQVVKYLAGKNNYTDILKIEQWLLDIRNKVLRRANLNPQLLLEALLLQLCSLR